MTALGQLIMVNSPTSLPSLHYLLQSSPPKASFVINQKEGFTALHAACVVNIAYEHQWQASESVYDHKSGTLAYLIRKAKELGRLDDQELKSGRTALHSAVLAQNEFAVEELLDAGAKTDIRSNVNFHGKWVGVSKGLTAFEVASRMLEEAQPAKEKLNNGQVLSIAREIRDLLEAHSPMSTGDQRKGGPVPPATDTSPNPVSDNWSTLGILLSVTVAFAAIAGIIRRSQ